MPRCSWSTASREWAAARTASSPRRSPARARQEVPHAVEVQIDELEEREGLVWVRALLWVETESQKGIVIGARGRMIKAIGMAARREIEREIGTHVHLDLSVRVRRSWRGDETLLDRLGIT